jgi:hypothetical protein
VLFGPHNRVIGVTNIIHASINNVGALYFLCGPAKKRFLRFKYLSVKNMRAPIRHIINSLILT